MQCEHRGCNCSDATVNRVGKNFCSEFCANAETTGHHEDRCRCGHPDCAKA